MTPHIDLSEIEAEKSIRIPRGYVERLRLEDVWTYHV